MKKRGLIGIIISVVVALLLIGLGIGFYFYNYHVFKTVRICTGDGVDSELVCNSNQECLDLTEIENLDFNLSNMPDLLRSSFQEIIDDAIYCNKTCFVKKIRGINSDTGKLEMLENCEDDENEFVIEIRGKDGIDILKYLSSKK
jgi:hypothetical protein